jgi:hypothetical protein
MLDSGFIVLVADHYNVEERLYSLSTRGKNICIKFYKHLSGEEKIPMTSNYNPLIHKAKDQKYTAKKLELIKKLNETDRRPHNKKLY